MGFQATYDDANLVLRLFELRREEKLRAARDWFTKSFRVTSAEDYLKLCPPGSQNDAYFRMITSYWNMAASFVTAGVLNQDLFLDNAGELLFVWTRIRDILPAWRESMGNPRIMTNIEKVAQSAIERMNQNAPGGYEQFAKMVMALPDRLHAQAG